MIKINFISISPIHTNGSVTVAFFDAGVETKQWPVSNPEREYELTFRDAVKDFIDRGATLVLTSTKQVDVRRTNESLSITELPDIKKEN